MRKATRLRGTYHQTIISSKYILQLVLNVIISAWSVSYILRLLSIKSRTACAFIQPPHCQKTDSVWRSRKPIWRATWNCNARELLHRIALCASTNANRELEEVISKLSIGVVTTILCTDQRMHIVCIHVRIMPASMHVGSSIPDGALYTQLTTRLAALLLSSRSQTCCTCMQKTTHKMHFRHWHGIARDPSKHALTVNREVAVTSFFLVFLFGCFNSIQCRLAKPQSLEELHDLPLPGVRHINI